MAKILPRQHMKIARLVAQGKSNREIANELNYTLNTVEKYVNEIYSVLHIRNRVELAQVIHEGWLITPIDLMDGMVIREENMPIAFQCKHSSTNQPDGDAIWVILEDKWKQYYLQHPPCKRRDDGIILCTNVLPGCGIEKIHVLQVDAEGNEFFQNMAARRMWHAFTRLPAHTIVKSVGIMRECQIRSC